MAFAAIGFAAATYDSIPNKKMAAQTYEIAYKKYHDNEKTPGMLYSACLTYDEAKLPEEAIRCSKDLVRDYPKSSYALDAAFSIPVAYQNAKRWSEAADAYIFFAKTYTSDKEKLIAAYIGTARAYRELKDDKNAADYYKKTIDAYDKYGLQIKNADPGVPAEAAYYLGEMEYAKMETVTVSGKQKQKDAAVKKLTEILKVAVGHYSKSATYASEQWTFRATNKIGFLFVTMAAKIREQELNGKTNEEQFAERIGIVQQLPGYYDQAQPIFQKNIDLARDQGFYNADVIAAEEGYIEMYYQGCAVFVEVGDAFANSPLPDSAEIVAQYVEYDGMTKEDAAAAAGDDLEAYREELASRSQAAREAAVPRCATGIRASEHYGIDNQWTQKLYDMLRELDEQNEALQVKITKFDATKLFQDPTYFKTKARLDQVRASKVMTKQEQLATYQEILKDAQAENEKLRAELKELQARLAPPPSAAPAQMP
jgi:tetratricopeptide (TPR) repeat protein